MGLHPSPALYTTGEVMGGLYTTMPLFRTLGRWFVLSQEFAREGESPHHP